MQNSNVKPDGPRRTTVFGLPLHLVFPGFGLVPFDGFVGGKRFKPNLFFCIKIGIHHKLSEALFYGGERGIHFSK